MPGQLRIRTTIATRAKSSPWMISETMVWVGRGRRRGDRLLSSRRMVEAVAGMVLSSFAAGLSGVKGEIGSYWPCVHLLSAVGGKAQDNSGEIPAFCGDEGNSPARLAIEDVGGQTTRVWSGSPDSYPALTLAGGAAGMGGVYVSGG